MNIQVSHYPPIFILCCDRSGSSLLRYIIDTHPEIASPAELNLGQVCQDLYYLVAGTLGEVTAIEGSEKEAFILAEVRRLVAGVMERYVAAKNKQMWCEKSPRNLQFLKIITAVFPEAKYICLHRHAMDVVHSCLETSRLSLMGEQLNYVCQNSGSIVGAMVQNWVEKTRQILEFEQAYPAQCFQIKYESYVLNPADTLQPMFEFLAVPWQPTILDSVFSVKHDLGPEDPKVAYSNRIHKNSIGKGAQIDTLRIAPHLLKEMNTLLATLNYPIVDSDWGTGSSAELISDISENYSETSISSSVDNAAERLINFISSQLSDLIEALEGHQAIYKVIVTGSKGSCWMIDLTHPSCPITPGNREADCTLTFSPQDATDVVNGILNPIELWMQGKLNVSGNRKLAEIFCWLLVGRLQWRKPSASWWLE